MSERENPFTSLGHHLRYVREQSNQSLAEVSGAVEIDEKQLARIEAGIERPAEEILLLLISHFGVKDREAVQLWELAEYDSSMPDDMRPDADLANKPTVMLLAMDMRTMYSDGLNVVVNPSGVTLNFTQQTNPTQTMPVARVGMSHQQAELVIKTLQQALLHAKYNGGKLLPPSSKQDSL
jgi:transcriptional regulator with XRE-family HTH domain